MTHSAADDIYPEHADAVVPRRDVHQRLLAFQGVETTTNVRQGNGYAPLDQPTAGAEALVTKYNAPPYVDGDAAGSIPFMDFANKAVSAGARLQPAAARRHDAGSRSPTR